MLPHFELLSLWAFGVRNMAVFCIVWFGAKNRMRQLNVSIAFYATPTLI